MSRFLRSLVSHSGASVKIPHPFDRSTLQLLRWLTICSRPVGRRDETACQQNATQTVKHRITAAVVLSWLVVTWILLNGILSLSLSRNLSALARQAVNLFTIMWIDVIFSVKRITFCVFNQEWRTPWERRFHGCFFCGNGVPVNVCQALICNWPLSVKMWPLSVQRWNANPNPNSNPNPNLHPVFTDKGHFYT